MVAARRVVMTRPAPQDGLLQPTAEGPFGYGAELAPGARNPAPYAASGIPSRGRQYCEPDCPTRSPFQRDRDRILHATAFRRLTHKTQVFVYHEGDHYRTRLTHSLEVAQIARTIARQLRLDEDLAETLALAHDLGHPPFGHAGERALDEAMADFGGFDHNAQSLRVVTKLERKYQDFDGLNLTWETLEGLAKHNGPLRQQLDCPVSKVCRPIERWQSLSLESWAGGEAQVAALADDIAYLTHDVDDGLRAGLIAFDELASMPFKGPMADARPAYKASSDPGRTVFAVTRRMITTLIRETVAESRRRLAILAPTSPDHIRRASNAIIALPEETARDVETLRGYLFERVYRHPRVGRVMAEAEKIVRALFSRYADPTASDALPERWRQVRDRLDGRGQARLAADYLAGQTDRFALAEYARLFDATPELR